MSNWTKPARGQRVDVLVGFLIVRSPPPIHGLYRQKCTVSWTDRPDKMILFPTWKWNLTFFHSPSDVRTSTTAFSTPTSPLALCWTRQRMERMRQRQAARFTQTNFTLSTPPSHSNDPGISGKSSVIRKNCRKPVFNGNMAICITLYLAKVWLFLESKYFIMRLLAFRKSFLLEKTKLICIWVSQAKFWIYPIDFSSIFRFNSCCFNSNILLLSVFSF